MSRKKLLIVYAASGCLLCGLAISGSTLVAEHRVAEDLADAKRLGLPTTIEELSTYQTVPLSDNAAILYAEAYDKIRHIKDLDALASQIMHGRAPYEVYRSELLPALALIERASNLPKCRIASNYNAETPWVTLPEYGEFKPLFTFLLFEADAQAAQGNWERSLALFDKAYRMAGHANMDPSIDGLFKQTAFTTYTEQRLRITAKHFKWNREALDAAIRLESAPPAEVDLRRTVAGLFVLTRAYTSHYKRLRDFDEIALAQLPIPPGRFTDAVFGSRLFRANFDDRLLRLYLEAYRCVSKDTGDLTAADRDLRAIAARVKDDRSGSYLWSKDAGVILGHLATAAMRIGDERQRTRDYLRRLRGGVGSRLWQQRIAGRLTLESRRRVQSKAYAAHPLGNYRGSA